MRCKDKACRVCSRPCSGRVCRDCFTTKNNKHAKRYVGMLQQAYNTNTHYKHSSSNNTIEIEDVF